MKNKCIILGDIHQNTLEGIKGLLESVFDKIAMVSNLPSLFEVIDKIKPKYVVIDFSMLAATGVKTIGEIKNLLPNLKIIVLGFVKEPAIIEDVMSAGASGYVLKQYAGTDLLNAFDVIEQGHTFISPAVQNINSDKET